MPSSRVPASSAVRSHTLSAGSPAQIPLFMEASTQLPNQAAVEHGEVFTRRWVVELILDLVGYTPDRDLAALTILEPACGSGAFLVPIVERLLESVSAHGREPDSAVQAILTVDLLPGNVARSRNAVVRTLAAGGVEATLADRLAQGWIQPGDFLLQPPRERSVDIVVGNPPYLRLEAVPSERSAAYRRACSTMGGRADVYVGFYEHALLALRDGGTLGFICADRWMRNAYGAGLRGLISSGWAVEAIVSMTGVDAFEAEVDAYPAITVLRRQVQVGGPLVVESASHFGPDSANEIVALAKRRDQAHARGTGFRAARLGEWFAGRGGWPNASPDRLAVIAELEASFPSLEDPDLKTKVGIGVATGADRVFILQDAELVEPERLLPLALPRDIASGEVRWSGSYLANPWDEGGLVDLADWPRLAGYLGQHHDALARRHTAQRGRWHKTIDRVIDGLVERPKLYLPDFKDVMFPVLDRGETYPHHNLYWVTSETWDLRVLGGLLMSDVANLFIEAYSVRMRGGFLRFQAQYLRRIRLPHVTSVDAAAADALATAFDARDRALATQTALRLYGLEEVPS